MFYSNTGQVSNAGLTLSHPARVQPALDQPFARRIVKYDKMKLRDAWAGFAKSRLRGGVLFVVGYILSPLSWWNDAFVNLPLAYGFGSLVSLLSKRLFLPAMVLGYWATNIVGLVLMSRGAVGLARNRKATNPRKEMVTTLAISVLYTAVVILLVRFGILKAAFHRR